MFQAALLALAFLVNVSAVNGETLRRARFSWDAVADPSVSGYKVHWGTQSGVYDHSLDAGNVTEVLISGFAEGVEYFSAITAYSATGEASDYSTEMTFAIAPAGGTATPVITTQPTASDLVYGQTLASSSLSGGVASVAGTFTFTAPATAPAAGTALQSVTFTPADTVGYQTATTSVSVTVSKATPVITTEPTATGIIYGQTLANSTLSGGAATVPGSFAFTAPTTVPAAGGTSGRARFSWDAVPHPSVSGYVVHWGTQSGVYDHSLDAGNVTEVLIAGFAEGVDYFSAITAYNATGETSDYSVEMAFTVLSAGGTTEPVSSHSVTFTPSDTANYQIVTTNVNVTVSKATPSITTQPTATAITYGQTLASSTLSGGAASVPGSFAFTMPATAPAAGTASQSVTFTPTDTGNYQTATTSVNVMVNHATATATVTLGNLAATYDGTLKAASATTNPSGLTVNLTYDGSVTAPTNTGSYAVLATIVDANYLGSASGTLVIAKATPLITIQPTATDIIYGQTLASSTLSGGAASVPGSFAFTAPATVPAAGGTSGRARFSWDAVAHPSVSGYVVHWGTQSGVYDHSFDAGNVTEVLISGFAEGVEYFSAITAYSATGETSDYSVEMAFTVLSAGGTAEPSSTHSVTFTPSDTANYQMVTTSVNVTVSKATPSITTQPSAANLTYGQTLASSTLSGGTASVPGAFAFTTPLAAPAVGTASHNVMFTPSDTGNYQIVTTSVNVTVAKATPLITAAPTATDITNGQSLASSTLSGGAASVPGFFAFTTPATTPPLGTSLHAVTFTPADTLNYQSVSASVSVTVNKPAATVTLSKLAATYDGKVKSASATTSPTGLTVKLTYNGSATAPKNAGSYAVLATVVDATYAGSASGTLVIAKATPSITRKPTAKAIVYGQTLANCTLSGGSASVAGSFAFTTPATVPPVGTTSHSVTFTPTNMLNYATATTSVNVTVKASTTQAIVPESLEIWRARCFSSDQTAAGEAADDADPDRDGLLNLAEYALGTSPLDFTPPLTADKNSDGLVLTFERPSGLPDVLYAAESSDDLIHWNPCLLEIVADGPVQTMRAIDPLTSGNPARRFISLRFTKP